MKKMIHRLLTKLKRRYLYFIIALIVFALDMTSKYLVELYLQDIVVKNIFGNVLVFIYTRNYGVAFGFLNNISSSLSSIMPILIKVLVAFAICLIVFIILNTDPKKQRLSILGFSFILGGALGNFFDRYFRGYVTDFINMGINENIRFNYNYNLADAFISMGIILIVIGILFLKEDKKNIKEEDIENKPI